MSAIRSRRDPGGFTLVEVAIVVAMLGIMVMFAVSSFSELREKYAIESETKNLYAALMEARGRAAQRSRYHFVRITANGYTAYEDTNPAPDGNLQYDSGDNRVVGETVRHPIVASLSPTGTADNVIFDRRGIATGTGYIRIDVNPGVSANPDYNCVTIKETRLRTGRMSGGTCVEK